MNGRFRKKRSTLRSKFEDNVALWLTQNNITFEYETQKLEYTVKEYSVTCNECGSHNIKRKGTYTPDFILTHLNIILEAKGRWSAQDRKKIKAIKEQHPEVNLYMVFMYDNWVTKNKNKRYSDICTALNIPFCIGIHNLKSLLGSSNVCHNDNKNS